jgi:hypothetical protein
VARIRRCCICCSNQISGSGRDASSPLPTIHRGTTHAAPWKSNRVTLASSLFGLQVGRMFMSTRWNFCLLSTWLAAVLSPALAGASGQSQANTASLGVAVLVFESGAAGSTPPVLVNGSPGVDRMALFADDHLETGNVSAELLMSGATVLLAPGTIAKIEKKELRLDHGSVRVTTGMGFRVRAECVSVTPTDAARKTDYEVTDTDGNVKASALLKDIRFEQQSVRKASSRQSSNGNIVLEGKQASRGSQCGTAIKTPSATDGILNSTAAKWSTVGAMVGVTCQILCKGYTPVSPSAP